MSAQAQHDTPTAHPVTLIKAAVIWARASGIPVRLVSGNAGRGVHCVSSIAPNRWERDPRASAVDPVGATLLNYQPEATDPIEAAAECLFAPVPWILAFEAGLNREDFVPAWADATDRMLRVAAYEAGIRYRRELLHARPAKVLS